MLLEHLFGHSIVPVGAQGVQRIDCHDAPLNALPVLGLDVMYAGNFLAQGACADQAHYPGDFDFPVVLLLCLIDAGNEGQACGSRLGLPHGFNCSHLGLLGFTHGIAGFVPQHDHAHDRGQAKGSGHPEAALGELDIALFQQVPTGDRQNEHGASDIAGRYRVHEFGLGIRVEQDGPEVCHFHAHRLVAELGTHGVLHPAIGNQDPQRRQIGAHSH